MASEPRESSDLLAVYKKEGAQIDIKRSSNQSVDRSSNNPPDGGVRAFCVMAGSLVTNGFLFGIINSCGVINETLSTQLRKEGVPNADARAALVGSLAIGTTFLLSPLSGVLTTLMGIRMTAVLGGALASLGLFLSSFVTDNVDALYFTNGFLFGLGASLAYTPSLAILGHYFKKYLGIVNGIVTFGSSLFTVIMLPLMKHLISNYGLDKMFLVLSVLALGVVFCGLLFKPLPQIILEKPSREDTSWKKTLTNIVGVAIWKNRKYRYWVLSMPVALFGYFVPYSHMQKFVDFKFPGSYTNLPIQCIAVMSGLGRLIFGYLADKPKVDTILMQQLAFYVIGSLTIVLAFAESFSLVVAISLGIGLCDGAFISLIGPVAISLCGGAYAAQAIGCMLGLVAVPLSFGPALAAYIITINNSYTSAFILAGISPIVGATLMFAIRFRERRAVQINSKNGQLPLGNGTVDLENSTAMLERTNQRAAL